MQLLSGDYFELRNIKTGEWKKHKCRDIDLLNRTYIIAEEGAYPIEVAISWLDNENTIGNVRNHSNRYGLCINDCPISAPVMQMGPVNPHMKCRHEWKTENYFSGNQYTTCIHCKQPKEKL